MRKVVFWISGENEEGRVLDFRREWGRLCFGFQERMRKVVFWISGENEEGCVLDFRREWGRWCSGFQERMRKVVFGISEENEEGCVLDFRKEWGRSCFGHGMRMVNAQFCTRGDNVGCKCFYIWRDNGTVDFWGFVCRSVFKEFNIYALTWNRRPLLFWRWISAADGCVCNCRTAVLFSVLLDKV
jgi:hypothetical protein